MRLRKAHTPNPRTQGELDAIDRFLTGDHQMQIDAALAELMLALEDERPVPREEFVRALDGRVATGFSPSPGSDQPDRPKPASWLSRRPAALALGTAAAVFIVVVALVVGGGGGASTPSSKGPAGAAATAPVPPVPGGGGGALQVRPRKVERSASLTLAPPRDEVENVADAVIRTTDRYGGFVFNSNVSSGDDGAGATLDLRLPAAQLQAALADLSKLAHVRARSEASQDVTARFVAPRRKLEDALAERRALLRRLAGASTANETASIRARLRLAGLRIDSARAALRRLDNRVRLAAVSVSVEPGSPRSDGNRSPGDAVGDALAVLGAIAGGTLVALAVLVPAAILLTIGLAARAAYLRRVREASLGPVEKPPLR